MGLATALLFWAFGVGPPERKTSSPADMSIEEVVRDARKLAGTPVRVRGRFRGRNLFSEDWCEGAPPAGWALREGRFLVWVTGKKPQGKGWFLDPTRLDDALRWLEVVGKVEVKGECVVLQAQEVELVSGSEGGTR